ncbi:MAG TPA: arginase family protein [Mesorhizobium sp.]|jgi:agmatinase|nr:arginase family protein [Mesorhizobium sp.]
MSLSFNPPAPPFFGAALAESAKGFGAAVFAAPHGTPYPGIDNTAHEGTGAALREALADEPHWAGHWNFDFDGPLLGEHRFRLADVGDLPTTPLDGPRNRGLIEAATREVLAAGAVPIMLGGDDSVPIPFIAGFSEAGPLTILQIDAHIDWREERRGERFGYSSTMRRASEMGHVERIVQVGARGLGSARREEVETARAWGARIVPARELHAQGVEAALRHVPQGARVLVTLDCDGLDPSANPAVVAPTPGGLTYAQVIDLLEGVGRRAKLVGFDLIEFVPARDPTGIGAITAANIVVNVVGRLAKP